MTGPTTLQTPLIQIRDVTKCFKQVCAVNGVNLSINSGAYVALLGPNGAGKTTLIEMIEGIQKPDSGEILFRGLPFAKQESRLRNIMGISLQETRFIDKITVRETLALFASFYGISDKRTPDEIMDLIDLGDKSESYVMNLSGGQRQRLALGIALINKPEILLLDEPTTGLDPNARREIWGIIKNLRTSGTTLLLTTHYMEEAESLCESIIIMHRGKFIAQGTMDELREQAGNGEIIEFSLRGRIDPADLPGLRGVSASDWDEITGHGRLMVRHNAETLPALLDLIETRGLALQKLECRSLSLDDLFISMTGERLDD